MRYMTHANKCLGKSLHLVSCKIHSTIWLIYGNNMEVC